MSTCNPCNQNLFQLSKVSVPEAQECAELFWNWANSKEAQPEHYPDENVIRFLAALKKRASADSKDKKRVLDLGAAGGKHLMPILEFGFEAYGLDWAEAGLAYASNRAKDMRLSQPHLARTNLAISNLPYANDLFDRILATFILDHLLIRDACRILKECARVLKPDGLMLVSLMSTGTTRRDKRGIPLQGELKTELVNYGPSQGEIHRFFEPQEMQVFLKEHFSIISTTQCAEKYVESDEMQESYYFSLRKREVA